MNIKRTTDFDIKYEDFGITEKIIKENLKNENLKNNQLNKNRIIIGLIIGEIREKINQQFEQNNNSNLEEVIQILNETLKLDKKINEEIFEINLLVGNILYLDFNSIDEQFLYNQIKVGDFIEKAEKFCKS